jgi:hypothetical protein
VTTRRGFRYDSGRSRLEVIVDGTVVAVFNNIAPSLSLTAPLEVGSGGTGVTSLTNPTFQSAIGVHSLGMGMVIGG